MLVRCTERSNAPFLECRGHRDGATQRMADQGDRGQAQRPRELADRACETADRVVNGGRIAGITPSVSGKIQREDPMSLGERAEDRLPRGRRAAEAVNEDQGRRPIGSGEHVEDALAIRERQPLLADVRVGRRIGRTLDVFARDPASGPGRRDGLKLHAKLLRELASGR